MNAESFYAGKRVILLGASGMIGGRLAQRLSAASCALDTARRDVSTPDVWDELVDADVIFHLAAHESRTFEPELDLRINGLSVLYMLEACRRKKVFPKIIFASSSNLVGAPKQMPVNETFKDDPLTIFAVHKLLAEHYLRLYAQEFQIPSSILRLANVYGPAASSDASLHSTLNKMISNALDGKPLKLFSNKECVRDFLYIDDAVEAFMLAGAAEPINGQMYLVGSGEGRSFTDIVTCIAELTERAIGRRPEILLDDKTPIAAVEMRNFVADTSKYTQLTGWEPRTKLREGVQKTIEYFLTHRT